MTSTNGSEPVGKAASDDPAVLAAEIEKTREDLAETLDAIAEKVSPKRVAGRTKKKVANAVTSAKETVVEQAGAAKDKVTSAGSGGSARPETAPEPASERLTTAIDPTAPVTPLPPVTAVQADHLDLTPAPTTTPTVPATPTTTPTVPATPYEAPGPLVRKEYAAGAGLGVVVLLLLRRRRNRRRALLPKGRRRRR